MSEIAPEAVLEFWFGALDAQGMPAQDRVDRWFDPPEGFDALVRDRFGAAVESALAGTLDAWAQDPRHRLALVLLLDQLTRNRFRGTARAFAGDARALGLVLEAIDAGQDAELALIERTFLYMPLMHAEDLAVQHRCVALYEALAGASDGPLAALVRNNHAFALRHLTPIERFGRFPSRNAALGRESSAEELAWLKGHPNGF